MKRIRGTAKEHNQLDKLDSVTDQIKLKIRNSQARLNQN